MQKQPDDFPRSGKRKLHISTMRLAFEATMRGGSTVKLRRTVGKVLKTNAGKTFRPAWYYSRTRRVCNHMKPCRLRAH